MNKIQGEALGPALNARLFAVLLAVVFALSVWARPAPGWAAAERSSEVDAQVAALRAEAEEQKAKLDSQQNQIEQLRMLVEAQTAILRQAGLLQTAGRGANSGRVQLISDTPTSSSEGSSSTSQGGATADRPRSERAADQLLVEAGGVLLPRWTLQVEPSADVTHVSNPRVNIFGYTIFNAINIGTIRVDDISQDILNTTLSARLGLPHRTQFDIRVPFTQAFVRQTKGIGTGVISELSTQGHHLGDIQATFSWQPVVERNWIPAIVLRARATIPTGESVFQIPLVQGLNQTNGAETDLVRAPTGSGYYSIEPGFTAVWRSDPLVLFIGGSYAHTFPTSHYVTLLTTYSPDPVTHQLVATRSSHDYGILDPGDVIAFNAGVNFAVNERASLNFSFVDQYSTYTRQRAVHGRYATLYGTSVNDARLGVGASFGLTDNVALVVNAGMGLTDQSPGYTFAVSLPITLPLRR
jgi:hypothetical protein